MTDVEVTSLISNTIDILKVSTENYQTIKDDKGFREAFHEAGRALHIVEEALQTSRIQLDGRGLAGTRQGAVTSLDGCNTKANLSESIFKIVAQAPETARLERYKAAVQQQSNGQTVEALALGMMEDVCNLAKNDSIKAEMEHHVNKLQDAMEKLSKMEPSVPNEHSGNSFHAYGDSRQFNALGGTQNNNTGSGNQFPGAVFSGSVNFAKNP
jgi:hypothetical protein